MAKLSKKYCVSYQQIYAWVRKYEEDGVAALADKRGKRKEISEMTELERLRAENRLLQAKIKEAKMENALLKNSRNWKEGGSERGSSRAIVSGGTGAFGRAFAHESLRGIEAKALQLLQMDAPGKEPRELENAAIVHEFAFLYAEHNGTYGYRRLADESNKRNNTTYNDKRFYRLAQLAGLRSVIRRKNQHTSAPRLR